MEPKQPIKTGSENKSSDEFLKKSQALLNDSVEMLDDDVKDKLYAARREILAEHHNTQSTGNSFFKMRRFLPSTGIALTASVIMGIFIQSGLWQSNDINLNVELELVSTMDNIELYDDLDFYQWLAEDDLQAG